MTKFAGLGGYKFVHELGTRAAPNDFGAVIQYYLSTGAFVGILFTFRSIKSAYVRADAEAKVSRHLAHTDFLTKLPNRRHTTQRLHQEIERSERYDRSFCIILFDLDRFKRVNDEYGHDVGDAVLQEVATVVTRNLRSADHVGRWGGEEFLIVAPEVTLGEAVQQAERLRHLLAECRHEEVGSVSASFGVAASRSGETAHELLRRADMALRHAKEAGRNRATDMTVGALT